MVCTNMILIGTLKDNMNFDVLSRNCILVHYFVLFLLHEAPERKNRSILTTVVVTDTEEERRNHGMHEHDTHFDAKG